MAEAPETQGAVASQVLGASAFRECRRMGGASSSKNAGERVLGWGGHYILESVLGPITHMDPRAEQNRTCREQVLLYHAWGHFIPPIWSYDLYHT